VELVGWAASRKIPQHAAFAADVSRGLLAWPMRNAKVSHAWIPTRTTVGFEVWMRNRLGADGFLDESLFPTYNQKELSSYKKR
jgi:hypothetical protein